MSEQNVETIRSVYDAFARGDIPYILEQLDPAVEWHAPPTVPFSKGLHRGPNEVGQFFAGIAEYVAEPSVETYEFISAGARVVVLTCFRGRGMKSGVPFEAPEVHVWKLSRGKVVEERSYADTAAIVQALQGEPAPRRSAQLQNTSEVAR
jgi:ketosteroid isomerase-like protein